MKLKITLLLAAFACIICGCSNEKSTLYNCKYYSLSIPNDEWSLCEEKIPGGIGNFVMINRTVSENITSIILILSFEQIIDPEYMLETNLSTNMFFNVADLTEISECVFCNINSKCVSSATVQSGVTYLSTAYAFVKDNISYVITVSTKEGCDLNYDKYIWNTMKFNNVDSDTKGFINLDDKITTMLDDVKSAGNFKAKIDEGLYGRDISFDKTNKILIYDYDFTETDIPQSYRSEYEAALKPIMIEELKRMKINVEMVRESMNAGYSFKYRYFYDDNVVAEINITSEEYN